VAARQEGHAARGDPADAAGGQVGGLRGRQWRAGARRRQADERGQGRRVRAVGARRVPPLGWPGVASGRGLAATGCPACHAKRVSTTRPGRSCRRARAQGRAPARGAGSKAGGKTVTPTVGGEAGAGEGGQGRAGRRGGGRGRAAAVCGRPPPGPAAVGAGPAKEARRGRYLAQPPPHPGLARPVRRVGGGPADGRPSGRAQEHCLAGRGAERRRRRWSSGRLWLVSRAAKGRKQPSSSRAKPRHLAVW
jgi:hypothetical protein